jgi:archaellum component FlaC
MGYLDASYRQVSPEFAASEYKKLDECLTVCIPEPVKREIKDLKAGYANLTETTTLQGESIEGYRRITADLKEQLNKQNAEREEDMKLMEEVMSSLVYNMDELKHDFGKQITGLKNEINDWETEFRKPVREITDDE